MMATASNGLARIPRRNAPRRGVPARAAFAAVVSHSSRLRRVMPRRTRVIPIACSRFPRLIGHEGELQPAARRLGAEILGPDAQKGAPRLPPPGAARQRERAQQTRKQERRETDGRPRERSARQKRPPEHEQEKRRRRRHAATQVVEDLPSGDEGQVIPGDARARPHERKQPPENLPIAAHPAVLSPGVGEDARGIVVHDLDVGHQGRARVEPFEQVVRQQGVLRDAAIERLCECIDVVQPLSP
jgi:hypothetical protein